MKIRDLIAAGQMQYLLDGRKGSLLDYSGKGLGAATVTGTPTFRRTHRGWGLYAPSAGSNYVSPGNPAGLQLSSGTVFAVASRGESNVATYQGIVVKWSAYSLFFNTGAENKSFGCYDWGAAAWRASTFSEGPVGRIHMFAMTFQSGVANGTAFYVDGNAYGLATMTIANQASNLNVGFASAAGQGLGGNVLVAGVSSRVVSPSDIAEWYDDYLRDGWILDVQHRRGVQWFVQDKSDADYAAQGIVLDTRFIRQPGGTLRDETGNYPGTVTGVPVPGPEGEGAKLAQTDIVTFGNVTQLNSVANFSIHGWMDEPSAFVAARYLWNKYVDANNHVYMYTPSAGATSALQAGISNAGASWGVTTAAVLRANTRQHYALVFNGAGVGNAARMQLYVDGEAYPITFTNTIPASTPNLAAANLVMGIAAGNTAPHTALSGTIRSPAMTAGEVRAEYLRSGAQQCIWQAPGEDMPVSLVASYGTAAPNALGGGWVIQTGDWKRSEDSQGRRYIECVTAGRIAIPQPNAFGTWTWAASFANPAAAIQSVNFVSSDPSVTTSYVVYNANAGTGGRYLAIARTGANIMYTNAAATYLLPNVLYRYALNRRPSDGRFTLWIKGGVFTNWTLVDPTGGFGTNPTAGDVTYVASAFLCLAGAAGDKWLVHDPTLPGNPCPTRIYRGVLNPTLGEVG